MLVLAALLLSVMVGSGQETNLLPPAKFKVQRKGNNPDQKQRITYDGSALDISNAALEQEFELEIQPLASTQLAGLHSGMSNVTRGPRRGYRMLPHGMKFRKEILISLPYDKALLPPGAGPEDIRTYFYNETSRLWEALPLVGVDAVAGTVTSATDHFTDFITSTITVPDHPETSNFTPTQMKNVKPADPAQGINLIQPPSENNQGAALLQSLIELPPGRNSVQPSLSVGYNSTGGNGWLGMGWSLAIPSVVIDTRWGVPRYDALKETETYSLNGKQLTPESRTSVLPCTGSWNGTPRARWANSSRTSSRPGSAMRSGLSGTSLRSSSWASGTSGWGSATCRKNPRRT